jgi:uncharacterized protein with HEPN domain
MPEREWRSRIEDMLRAIAAIQQYVAGKDELSLGGDPMMVDAVLFNFLIIGEAARSLPDDVTARYPDVP